MSSKINWHGDAAKAKIRAEMGRRIRAASIIVQNRAKVLLSTAGTGKVKGKRVGPVAHSAPGEPPRKQTGTLRASVTYEIDDARMAGRVGTNIRYGRHLELGTSKMAARPWLRRALAESRSHIEAIFARPMSDSKD
jgi:HK97 gp10 family phage protein